MVLKGSRSSRPVRPGRLVRVKQVNHYNSEIVIRVRAGAARLAGVALGKFKVGATACRVPAGRPVLDMGWGDRKPPSTFWSAAGSVSGPGCRGLSERHPANLE